jgi:hypothetical protein
MASAFIMSFALLLIVVAPSGSAAGNVEWVAHDTSPVDRLVFAYAELPDGRIFIVAGTDVSAMTLVNDTWIYDPIAKSWEQMADCPHKVESSCAVAMPDGNVYLFGGMAGPMLQNALIYHVANDTWSEGPALPNELFIAEAVALDDHRILIAGGLEGSWFSDCTEACWIFDTGSGEFTAAADMPADRCCGVAAAYGGKAFYFGGVNANVDQCDDIFAYDIAADEWSVVGHLPEALVHSSVVAGDHGNIYLIGGRDSFSWYHTGSVTAYSYDTFTGDMTKLPDLPAPVQNAAAFMLDGGMLMYMLGNNEITGNTDIFTLQTGEVMASLSSAEADQGESVWLRVWVETDLDMGYLSGSAYLVKDNVTYGEWHFSSAGGGDIMLEIAISEQLPAGNYTLMLIDVDAEGWWLECHVAPMHLLVRDAPSSQDRLDDLEQQNQDIMDQLDEMEQQNQDLMDQLDGLEQQNQDLADQLEQSDQEMADALAELQEAMDGKMDAMVGYIILIVALGALIVGVIVLVLKK